jgi:hypothetical protein
MEAGPSLFVSMYFFEQTQLYAQVSDKKPSAFVW